MTGPGKGNWDHTGQVRREERECPRHGMTVHAHWRRGGDDGLRTWQCVACQHDQKRTVTHRGPQKPPPATGQPCPSCGIVMPLTGVCDDC